MRNNAASRILLSISLLLSAAPVAAEDEVWIEVRSPHFIVISDASPKQARQTAKSFERFRHFFQTVWPDLKIDSGIPLVLYAGKDEKSRAALLGEDGKGKSAAQSAGVFLAGAEKQIVVLNLDAPVDRPFYAIFRPYAQRILQLNFGTLPPWLSEGLAELFANADISDPSRGAGSFSPEAARKIRDAPRIPLSELMSTTQASSEYSRENAAPDFPAQSWALVHCLRFGNRSAHQEQLNAYIRMVMEGVPRPSAASRAFGDLKDLEKALDSCLAAPDECPGEEVQLKIDESRYKSRTLPPAEALACLGDILVQNNKLDRAQATLERALRLDPKSARANEGLGHLYLRLKEEEKAGRHFTLAAELDPKNCLAHYLAAAVAMPEDSEYASAKAEKHLRKAISINPQFAPAFRSLSQLLARKRMFLEEALDCAKKAAALEPGRLAHRLNIASVLAAMEKTDEAEDLGRRILAAARDPNDRLQAESFLNRIEETKTRDARYQRMKQQQEKETKEDEERFKLFQEGEKKRQALSRIEIGPAAKLAGIVQSVRCDFPAVMDVVLEAGGLKHRLHSENYYEVKYGAVGEGGEAKFEPCQDLEGKEVQVEYTTVSGQEFTGFIRSIVITLRK